MGATADSTAYAVLEPIKRGEEQGLHSCWCCHGFYRRCELTKHHKIPDRYKDAPQYREIVRQHADDDDLEGGLLVLVCPQCHDLLNMIDDNNGLRHSRLERWLGYWNSKGRGLGKGMFSRSNSLVGKPPNAKRRNKGPRRKRRG